MRRYLFIVCLVYSCAFAEYETQDLTIEKSQDSSSVNTDSVDDSSNLSGLFMPIIDPNLRIKDILDVYNDQSNVLDLKSLLDRAKDNYQMQAKDIAVEEAKATRSSIYGKYLPSIDVGYSFERSKRKMSGWQPSTSSHSANASASFIVFDGGSREFSLLSNSALVKAAIADKGYSQESLFLDVVRLYYDYFTLKGKIIAMEQKKVNIAANVARLEILYDSGLETVDALEALKAELSATQYELANIKLSFEQTKLQLSLYANTDVDKLKLVSIDEPKYIKNQSLNITMQEEQANSINYQVNTITYFPVISVFDTFTWNIKNNISSSLLTPQSLFSPKQQNIFGVNVEWNIFSGFTTNRQREALRLQNLRLNKAISYAKNEQDNNIRFYKKSISTALTQIKSAEAALKSATISFDSISKKYNAKLVNYNTYLDALSAKYNAEATFIQSLNNYELQKVNYIFYSGQAILDYVN